MRKYIITTALIVFGAGYAAGFFTPRGGDVTKTMYEVPKKVVQVVRGEADYSLMPASERKKIMGQVIDDMLSNTKENCGSLAKVLNSRAAYNALSSSDRQSHNMMVVNDIVSDPKASRQVLEELTETYCLENPAECIALAAKTGSFKAYEKMKEFLEK